MYKKTLIITGIVALLVAGTTTALAVKKPNFQTWARDKIAAIEQSIVDLGQQIVGLDERITTEVATIGQSITELGQRISGVEDRVTTLEGQSSYEYPEGIKPGFSDPATSIGYWQVQPGVHKLYAAVRLENDYGKVGLCDKSWWKFTFTDTAIGVVKKNNTTSNPVGGLPVQQILEFRTNITHADHLPMPAPGSEVEIDINVVCYGEHFHVVENYTIPNWQGW